MLYSATAPTPQQAAFHIIGIPQPGYPLIVDKHGRVPSLGLLWEKPL